MKKTLLQIVQEILNDMDSDSVNSISDTIESEQVASVVESTYNNIIASRLVPEHKELLKVTSASDTNYPTHFYLPDNVKEVTAVWYEDSNGDYKVLEKKDPLEFIYLTDGVESDYDTVSDKNGGTKLRIKNNADPTFFTSFDDYWLVMNSYKSSTETNLQNSKIRCYGTVYPTFTQSDSFTPDLDANMFPYLIAEAKSVCMSLFKGGSDPKIEQAARRQKSYIQNDLYRTQQKTKWSSYGRR